MNKSSLLGFAAIAVVFNLAVFVNTRAPGIFFDAHSLLVVLGGTIATALIAYPHTTLLRTIDYLIWGLIFKKKKDYLQISQDIAGARNSFLINQNYLTNDESHPFLRESVLLLLNKNIDNKAFKDILKNRSEFFKKRYVDDALVLRSLVKYPIALGLLAAFVKAASLLWNFEASTQTVVAHEAAMAFVAIFWGVAVSAILFFPLSDSANKAAEEDQEIRNLIIDGMILIREKATDDYFQAYLRGYLSLNDRSNFKIFSGKAGFGPYSGLKVPKIEIKEQVQTTSYMDSYESKERENRFVAQQEEEEVKPDPKPFEKLKSFAAPKLVNVEPEDVEEDEDEVADADISGSAEAVVGSGLVGETGEKVAESPVKQVANPENKVFVKPPSEAQEIPEMSSSSSRKKRRDRPELPGRIDEPIKIDENAPTTDLGTFRFKDLRQQASGAVAGPKDKKKA